MKTPKFKDLAGKDDNALGEELTQHQKKLFELRSQAVTAKLENPAQIGQTKKQIARIKTLQRQRQTQKAQ
jgi:large subunit ribosomal protein L29